MEELVKIKKEQSVTTSLILRNNARQELMQIKDIETGIEYLSKVKAVEVWAKAEKKDAELQNLIAEQKIRTQRILGQLIKEGQERGEIAIKEDNLKKGPEVPQGDIGKQTLSEIGITRNQSSMFKTIAEIPEKKFENYIAEKKTAVDNAVNELTTSGILAFAKGKPHVSNNSGENEWYTPLKFIKSARLLMGSITLDPASSNEANEIVKAETIYTKEDDGLTKSWFGNIWLNPPYAQPLISHFSDKLIKHLANIKQACVLTNNATETEWYQRMLERCDAVCFIKGRIKFLDLNGEATGAPLQGQSVMYFGENINEFDSEFSKYGICITTIT
jgi:phage N-6-adenine-methyltransferase